MSLRASFVADFTSFVQACDRADVALKKFDDGAATVNQKLAKLGNDFSGVKVVQQATLMTKAMQDAGGMAVLTEKELRKLGNTVGEASEKMKRLGLEVPPGFQKITDATENLTTPTKSWTTALGQATTVLSGLLALKVVGWAKEGLQATLDYADQLDNLSTATGISMGGLQRLESIGVTSSVSMETLAKSVEQLQKHLDDPAAIAAIENMGLSYEHIRNLKPEDQFVEIGKAIAGIEDPVERANAGAAIFGRTWNEIAPAINGHMQDILKSTVVMSDGTLKALNKAGDAWDAWYLNATRTLKSYLGTLVQAAQESQLSWTQILNPFALGSNTAALIQGGVAAQIKNLEELPDLPNAPRPNVARINTPDVFDIERQASKELDDQIKKGIKSREEAQKQSANAIAEAWKRDLDQVAQFQDKILGGIKAINAATVQKAHEIVPGFFNAFDPLARADAEAKIPARFKPIVGLNLNSQHQTFSLPDTKAAPGFADNLAAGVPNAILAAIQGGGSKLQAAGSAIGTSLFGKDSTATKAISGGLSALFGPNSFLTTTLSKAVPVISALIGPAIEGLGKLWGKVFGTAGRDAVRDFAAKEGGFDTLHKELSTLGAEGEAMWKSLTQGVGRNNSEQAAAAIKKTADALEAARTKVLALQTQLDTVASKMSHVTTIGPGLQSALDKAFNAKTANDLKSALEGINTEMDKQQAKFDLVKSTIAKYGLSFTDAGKDFKQAQINELANDLITDFNTLADAGFDTKTEVKGMSEQLSKFAQDSKKAGVEVPEDMRKILQAAIDNGQLFDENGDKITDMKKLGLNFGTSMETVMKHTIPDAIADLTTVLQGLADFLRIKLPSAARDGANGMNDAFSTVHTPDGDSPDYGFNGKIPGGDTIDAWTGGTISPFGLQYFEVGGQARTFGSTTVLNHEETL